MEEEEVQNLNNTVKLPIGIEDFEEIRTEGFYYVDKTEMITDLLHNWGKVNLFTRPRRFGKSLNMSMLKYFFSYDGNPALFDGLAVSREKELCEKYMGKFPVISITLKDVESRYYEGALFALHSVIRDEARRFRFMLEEGRLSEEEERDYRALIETLPMQNLSIPASEGIVRGSLLLLSKIISRHYGQKIVLLIDEYDVPLDKAQQYGYYDRMLSLIRGLFAQALKTNEHLFMAVLTGCLRVAKESIFTGLNNFHVMSIANVLFDEHFGFSDAEVLAMLEYYGLESHYGQIKEWYDGYRFGDADVYCPWDVINYVSQLRSEPDADPEAFWINSSGNAIIRTLLQKADAQTMTELDQLVNGLSVTKEICEELTYRELYDSIDNLWSILYTTGYLTKREKVKPNTYELAIPNQEIRVIFTKQILSWFQEEARKDAPTLDAFCEAFRTGDAHAIERMFTAYLKKTINIQDTAVRKEKKENFYHGILLGLLSSRRDQILKSSAQSGEGYSDILVKIPSLSMGIVIELKYSESRNLEAACEKALLQIKEKHYDEQFLDDDITKILKYGIACRRRSCMVRMEQ